VKQFSLLSVLLLFLPCYSMAQGTNSEIFRFLNQPTNARMAALGGNHPAMLKGDVSSMHANPAYMSISQNNDLALSYLSFLSDVNFAFAHWVHQVDNLGMAAASVRYVGFGDFQRTNEAGDVTGNFNAGEISIALGLGRKFRDNFHYGASIDFIHSNLDTFNSTALAFSAGALFINDSGTTTAGISFKNAGIQLSTFNDKREDLPFDVSLGASHKLDHTPVRFLLTLQRLDEWDLEVADDGGDDPSFFKNAIRHVIIGSELLLSENLHFRIGYNQFLHDNLSTSNRLDTAGMSFGLGININKFSFDISRSSFSDIGGSTQISLSTTL